MRERTRVLTVTSTVLFLSGLVWYNYSALLPRIVEAWSLSGTVAGIIFGAFQLGYVLAILPAGSLADRYSRRLVVAVGAAGTGLATLGFALFANGPLLGSLFRLVGGAAMAGVYIPGLRFLSDWYPEERRGTAIGIYVGAFSLSSGFSFFLSSAIASALGWRAAIAATSLGAIVSAPLILGLTRGHPEATVDTSGIDLSVLRRRSYLSVVAIYSGHNWELFGARNWITAFLLAAPAIASLRDPTLVAGTLVGIMVGVGAIANPVSGWLSDRFGRGRTLAVVLTLSATVSLTLGMLAGLSLPVLGAIVVVYGLLLTGDSAPTSTAVTESVPEEKIGAALALQSFAGFGVSIVSPVAFGAVLERFGYVWAFPVLALGPIVGLIALGALRRLDNPS